MPDRVLAVADALGEDHELLPEEVEVGSRRRGREVARAERLRDEAVDVLVVSRDGMAEDAPSDGKRRDEDHQEGHHGERRPPGADPSELLQVGGRHRRPLERQEEAGHGGQPEEDEESRVGQLLVRDVVHAEALRDPVPVVEVGADRVVTQDRHDRESEAGGADCDR